MNHPAEEGETLHQLERKAERTRADLVSTVDELRQRASPDALKAGVAQYVRDARHGMVANLRQQARENPLQAVALGAGLAYPAWRILCNLPAPVLLIGAGVALAGRSGTSGRGIEDSGPPAAARASHPPGGLEHTPAPAPPGVSGPGRGTAAGTASAATSAVPATSTHASTAQAASSPGAAGAGGRTSWDDLVREVEKHPLVAGGVGLLIGALFAASLPRSRVENELFGEASDELKSRASEAVSNAKVG